jgi:hypothetical protein
VYGRREGNLKRRFVQGYDFPTDPRMGSSKGEVFINRREPNFSRLTPKITKLKPQT